MGDFSKRFFSIVRRYLTKPHHEIWQELNGNSVLELLTGGKNQPAARLVARLHVFRRTCAQQGLLRSLRQNRKSHRV